MSGRMRIVFLIPSMAPGGTERQLKYLISGLADDHEIHLVCTRKEGAWYTSAAEQCVSARCLHQDSVWNPRNGKDFEGVFREIQPHVVHSFLFGFDVYASRAARRCHVPVVLSSRRELATWMKGRHRWIQQRANGYVDGIVANCAAVKQFVVEQEQVSPDKVHVIPNGIDVEVFEASQEQQGLRETLGLPVDKRIVGMVANFSPVKDHGLFVGMAERLLAQRDDIHFVLVGQGPTEDTIRGTIDTQGWGQHITFLPGREDIASVYGAMDVAVLTSRMEGSPNTILEAMASGTPVVAGAVGGIPELIEDGVTGRLIAERSPEDFAEAIRATLDDADGYEDLVREAREWVTRERRVEQLVAAYKHYYADLLNRKGVGL